MAAPHGVQVTGAMGERYDSVLTPGALELLAELHRTFDGRRLEPLRAREDRYAELAAGGTLDFLSETREVREGDWQVAPPAPGLVDRRVEITGPTDRKMTINALNSGAKVWLADQEDATSPTWRNVVEGQLSLRDAIRGELSYTSPGSETAPGKRYEVTAAETPTIVMRPRGWHLVEQHIRFTDRAGRTMAASGSLVLATIGPRAVVRTRSSTAACPLTAIRSLCALQATN